MVLEIFRFKDSEVGMFAAFDSETKKGFEWRGKNKEGLSAEIIRFGNFSKSNFQAADKIAVLNLRPEAFPDFLDEIEGKKEIPYKRITQLFMSKIYD